VVDGVIRLVDFIIIIDDCSSDKTASIVESLIQSNNKVSVIHNKVNQGVGGSVMAGYNEAINLGADIIVKMDSDDQMDPNYLHSLIYPIQSKRADYCKGNRFLNEVELLNMPPIRRIGNLGLSFLTKLATGYWNIFDPTNGYTAINSSLVGRLDPSKIDKRYFFETSMLLELGRLRAVVKDISIPARYGDEVSSLSEWRSLFEFPGKLLLGLYRRVKYQYFIRDFSATTMFLLCGTLSVAFGTLWGVVNWVRSSLINTPASTGTVMIAVLPVILGMQFLLQAFVMDIQNVPTELISELEKGI
jgi:glycosyltransferase involved in cell wall biosynthesis